MMRKTALLIYTVLIVLLFTGCEIISEKPIDAEYIAAYDAMETVYTYKYDWLHGEFRYLPELKMVHHDEEYKIQYERVWSDNSTETFWRTVSKSEYEEALKQIEKGGE